MQVGIIGGGSVEERIYRMAEEVGALVAGRGATVINGGLSGVMEASSRGAKSAGGTTVGILPGGEKGHANRYTDHVIVTDMGHGRNIIIAHTSDALIAIGGEYGTLSEISIALKLAKKVVSLFSWDIGGVVKASSPEEAVSLIFS